MNSVSFQCALCDLRVVGVGPVQYVTAGYRGNTMTDLNIDDCINERREKSESHTKPSETFRRYFGPGHGVELPLRERYGYRSLVFPQEPARMKDSTGFINMGN